MTIVIILFFLLLSSLSIDLWLACQSLRDASLVLSLNASLAHDDSKAEEDEDSLSLSPDQTPKLVLTSLLVTRDS